MLPSEHLRVGFPLVHEKGPGLEIGLVKDGVVVVTAILFSTRAICSVLLRASRWCVRSQRWSELLITKFKLSFIPVTIDKRAINRKLPQGQMRAATVSSATQMEIEMANIYLSLRDIDKEMWTRSRWLVADTYHARKRFIDISSKTNTEQRQRHSSQC